MCYDWFDVVMETSTISSLSHGNGGIIKRIITSIVESMERLVITIMEKV